MGTSFPKADMSHPEERQVGCEHQLIGETLNLKENYSLAKVQDHHKAAEYVCREAYRKKHSEEGEYLSRQEYVQRANQYAQEYYREKLVKMTDQRIRVDARDSWQGVLLDSVGLMFEDLEYGVAVPLIDSILHFLGQTEPEGLPAYNEFRQPGSTYLA